MAVQFDPIAKDESLNTTELTKRNIADVLAQELANITTAIGIASDIPIATVGQLGKVKPDGTSITIDEYGTISGASTLTAGAGIDITNNVVSSKVPIFVGTQAEWDALTLPEKKTYGQVNITDDESGVSSPGQKYVSASVTVSETLWTSKIFTFNTDIPKGKYLIGAKFAPSAGDKSVHCVISNLTSASFVAGYGHPISVATSEIYTKDTDGTVSMNYSCAINAANNPVAISLILIKIGWAKR